MRDLLSSMGDPANTPLVELADIVLTTAGAALCLFALDSFGKYMSNAIAFTDLKEAEPVSISGLRSLLSTGCCNEKLLVLRGFVQPISGHDAPVYGTSGQKFVFIDRTHCNITCDAEQDLMEAHYMRKYLPFTLPETCKYQVSKWMGKLPFGLTGSSDNGHSDFVSVSLDASPHSLPLTRVFHQLEDIHPAFHGQMPFRNLHNFLRPIGLIEDMILPVGKEITAVGFCSLQDGNPHIVACKYIPYFLSDKTREQMLSDLDGPCRTWFWCTIVLGSLSLGIFGYLLARNLPLWKKGPQFLGKYDVADVEEGSEKSCYQDCDNIYVHLSSGSKNVE